MIGNKLFSLMSDLTKNQQNNLLLKCRNSNDKRLLILKNYLLSENNKTIDHLNTFLKQEINKYWPNVSELEKDLKMRRLSNYYSGLIEKIILEEEYLEKKSSFKSILLANSLVKTGNTELVNYYYDKAYQKSIEEENKIYQVAGLSGKIRLLYTSQNEKKIEKIFEYNQELKELSESIYRKSVIDYYNNISNIYLEKNSLIKPDKEKYIKEIEDKISVFEFPIAKASLYLSLARLNFDNEKLYFHLDQAEHWKNKIELKNKAFYDFERKFNFLKLRLNFFFGKDVKELISLTDSIFGREESFSIINNNTQFYRIFIKILNNNIDEVEGFFSSNNVFFKGDSAILEQFLHAIIFEKKGMYKEAVMILQQVMYSTNYFFSILSRLLLIKIYIKQNKATLLKSLVDSTQRFLTINEDNPLGLEAHQYALLKLKSKYTNVSSKKLKEIPRLTIFHQYLLEE